MLLVGRSPRLLTPLLVGRSPHVLSLLRVGRSPPLLTPLLNSSNDGWMDRWMHNCVMVVIIIQIDGWIHA